MKRIGIYAGKNLLRIILLLFAVSILTFALVSASPIDPLQANVGQAALGSMSEEQKEKLRSYWGVDEPPVQRYLNWLNAFIKGDGGMSGLHGTVCSLAGIGIPCFPALPAAGILRGSSGGHCGLQP